jgi:hypothetical protein
MSRHLSIVISQPVPRRGPRRHYDFVTADPAARRAYISWPRGA